MMWLTWRQHRKQVLVTAILLGVLAALMIPSGLAMHNAFAAKGLDKCVAAMGKSVLSSGQPAGCGEAFHDFNNQFAQYNILGVLFLVLPLLVGLFWGAPLIARELESGTHRLSGPRA